MGKLTMVAATGGGLLLAGLASIAWIATAPAMSFSAADLAKPGNPSPDERRAMYEHCLSTKPPGVSPTRHLSVCTCQTDRLARELSRAEYVYLLHLSRDEKRLASAALKGLAAAGRPADEVAGAGTRGAQAVRMTMRLCIQNSLTPSDMARIRQRLEEVGIAPSAGTTELRDP